MFKKTTKLLTTAHQKQHESINNITNTKIQRRKKTIINNNNTNTNNKEKINATLAIYEQQKTINHQDRRRQHTPQETQETS